MSHSCLQTYGKWFGQLLTENMQILKCRRIGSHKGTEIKVEGIYSSSSFCLVVDYSILYYDYCIWILICHLSTQGHFIEVQVTDGALYRTKIHCYFLDQTRVVRSLPDEKNYHIFYQMLAGLTQEERGETVCVHNAVKSSILVVVCIYILLY